MSEQAPQEDRTEEASPKRRRQWRERGQVARSQELAAGITLLGGAGAIWAVTSLGSAELARVLSSAWYHLDEAERLLQTPGALLGSMARGMVGAALPVMGVLVVSALAAHISQVGLLWAPRALEPKLSKLDPVRGLQQKLASKDAAANLVKTLLKVVFVVFVAAGALWALEFDPGRMVRMPPEDFAGALEQFSVLPLLACALAMVGVGVLDFAWQRHRTEQRMKMTKEEARREHKESEGDPLFRGMRRQKHRELISVDQLIESVSEADVVINNPTHYSVALRYDPELGPPRVVAKGVDHRAAKIRELAAEADVPMVDNPPLARALHGTVDVGQMIPEALFVAVAETLAFVWGQRGGARGRPGRP